MNVAEEFSLSPITCALNGGEDYELVFTIKQADYEKLKDLPEIRVVGHIMDESAGCRIVTNVGEALPLQAQGWDALMKKQHKTD
jgi:thiamine-monophosphate kinase